MNRLILGLCAAAVIACGGSKHGGPTSGSAMVRTYTAARWVPANASYAITARTVRDAQQGLRDLIETFGVASEVTAADVGRALEEVLLVNPLSAEALANVGVDLDGGFAMFSEHLNPTFVVHLTSAAEFQAFIARQTELRMQSVVIGKTEVFTAPLPDGTRIGWAVEGDWLWVHFGFANDDGESWFRVSHDGSGRWDLDRAGPFGASGRSGVKGVATPSIVGFADGARLLAEAARAVPAIAQCVQQLQLGGQSAPRVGDLTLAIDTDAKRSDVQVALEVGEATASGIDRSLIGPPEGWFTAAAQVPLALQWNLDLAAARAKLDPCMRIVGVDLRVIDDIGVRAARAFLRSFDPDERKGTGVVAMDISHKDFFAAQLDQIPLRSTLERKRTFGPYAGRSLSIPMFLTVDYVLDDQHALAGVGDGLLAVVVGKGGSVKGPLAEIAVQPQGLSMESWVELLRLADLGKSDAKRVAAQLQGWREATVKLTIDGTRLLLALSGTRR